MPWYIYLLITFFAYIIGFALVDMLPQEFGVYLPRPVVKFFAPLWSLITPRTRKCTRCHLPFELLKPHVTRPDGAYPIQALCQHDWAQLTPDERLVHYERMMDLHHEDPTSIQTRMVTQAVRAGG